MGQKEQQLDMGTLWSEEFQLDLLEPAVSDRDLSDEDMIRAIEDRKFRKSLS
jgi:hypothetical protein